MFGNFTGSVEWNKDDSTGTILTLVEAILSSDWIQINTEYLLKVVHQFWNEGILRGHYTKWCLILSQYSAELTQDILDLATGYAICQRYLGQWSQAASVFVSVVRYAGRYGYFQRQAEALLELAILLRYQGDYIGVLKALNHIDTLPDSSMGTHIQNRLFIERTEFAIENNNIADAKTFLNRIPNYEPRKVVLQAEIYAKESVSDVDVNFLTSMSENLFLSFGSSPSTLARIHILMGRIWENISDIESAIKHLSIALSLLLEQDNDPFALARTQSNLAGVLIHMNRLTEASELINAAKYIQRQIGDRVGLATTMHNEYVIDRKIVN